MSAKEDRELAIADAKMLRQLHGQNAVHGMLGEIFVQLGGIQEAVNWAKRSDTNYGRLLAMWSKTAPSMIPQHGMQGDVNITINNNLSSTALDDITEYGPITIDHRDDED